MSYVGFRGKTSPIISEIAASVDRIAIAEQWCQSMKKLPVPGEYAKMCKLKYLCNDWRTIEVNSEGFLAKRFDLTRSLTKLESRF